VTRAHERLAAALPTLDRGLAWLSVLMPIAPVAAAIGFNGWPEVRHQILYVAPMLFACPFWMRLRLNAVAELTIARGAVDVAVVAVAITRWLGPAIPLSGHMLFLVYSGLTTRATGYRLLATALLIETTVFKLLLWSDPTTWGLGGLAGLLAAGARRVVGDGKADA